MSVKKSEQKKRTIEDGADYIAQMSNGLPLRSRRHVINVPFQFNMFSATKYTLDGTDYTEPTTPLSLLYQRAGILDVGRINAHNDVDVRVMYKGRNIRWLKLNTFISTYVNQNASKTKKGACKKPKIISNKNKNNNETKTIIEITDDKVEKIEDDSGICKICLDRPCGWVNYPCGHMHVCIECGTTRQKEEDLCILCRATIAISFKVFHDY